MKGKNILFYLLLFCLISPAQIYSFTKDKGFNNPVSIFVEQPDGKVLVGGNFTTYTGKLCGSGLTRLNADGTLDQEFANNMAGILFHSYVSSIVLQEDGKIVFGGSFKTDVDPTSPELGMARIRPDGRFDASFSSSSITNIDGTVESMVQQEDGKIIVGGNFTELNGFSVNGLARFDKNGTFDVEFSSANGSGINEGGTIDSILAKKDGSILLVGSFSRFSNQKVDGIVQLSEKGVPNWEYLSPSARPFSHGFTPPTREELAEEEGPYLPAAFIQKNGDLLLSGEFVVTQSSGARNEVTLSHLMRLKNQKDIDLAFLKNVKVGFINEVVQKIIPQSDGKYLLGSYTFISRLNSDGTIDQNFRTSSGTAFSGEVLSLMIASDGKIWLGGEFSSFRSIEVDNIARLNPDGSLDETFVQALYH